MIGQASQFPAKFYFFYSKNFEDGVNKKVSAFDSGEVLTKPVKCTVKGEMYLRWVLHTCKDVKKICQHCNMET